MSLSSAYDPHNIFAKIIRGDIPCAKIFEDERILSFMDAFPQSQGHCLVIAKTAATNLFDIGAGDLQNLISHTQSIARAAKSALKPDGVQILQYNGEAAGQSVFHLHFHIVPIWRDKSQTPHMNGAMADMASLQALAEQIKEAL